MTGDWTDSFNLACLTSRAPSRGTLVCIPTRLRTRLICGFKTKQQEALTAFLAESQRWHRTPRYAQGPCGYFSNGSTPVIETSGPNFRKESKSAIRRSSVNGRSWRDATLRRRADHVRSAQVFQTSTSSAIGGAACLYLRHTPILTCRSSAGPDRSAGELRRSPEAQCSVRVLQRDRTKDPESSIDGCRLGGCERGDVQIVPDLLRRGIDADARDRYGQTALMLAAHAGHHDVVETLNRANTIFARNPPSRVWVFSERITFYPAGAEAKGSGTTAYAWFGRHSVVTLCSQKKASS